MMDTTQILIIHEHLVQPLLVLCMLPVNDREEWKHEPMNDPGKLQ